MTRDTDKIRVLLDAAAKQREPSHEELLAGLVQGVNIVELFFLDMASIADSLNTIAQNTGK